MGELLYIAGPSYSGSTLLTFLLAAHPRIATVGELKATSMGDVEGYRCSCGSAIRMCPFWGQVGQDLRRHSLDFDLSRFGTHFRFTRAGRLANLVLAARVRGPLFEAARGLALRLLPGARRELSEIVARNGALIEVICTLQGGDVFLDGSKDPIRLKHLIEAGHWNPKVVHLVRDGRAFAHSYVRIHRCSMEAAAREWRETHQECERLSRRLPADAWLRVRHEDLCRDPDRVLGEILRLIGEPPARALPDFRSIEHHIVGNAMRLRSDGKIELNERWRSALGSQDLATFDRVAGDLNRQYGYA
jgi:hypothetical protein